MEVLSLIGRPEIRIGAEVEHFAWVNGGAPLSSPCRTIADDTLGKYRTIDGKLVSAFATTEIEGYPVVPTGVDAATTRGLFPHD
jgi:hypothetical protein